MNTDRQLPRPARLLACAILLLASIAPLAAGSDLDVCYISRTPRYWKYNVSYINGLDPKDWGNPKSYLTAEEQAKQRWPLPGEPVYFTAVIKNPGDAPTGTFAYKWFYDGVEVGSGALPSIAPGDQVSTTYTCNWDSEWINHTIKFVADPDNLITEEVETNNIREDRTNSLSFRFHVWQSVYDWFHANSRLIDPQIASFEDWAQRQIGYLNQMFVEAIYPNSPNGILERVRLDEVVIEPDDTPDPDPWACHAPANLEWDCRWGFTPSEYPQIFIENPQFISGPYMWGLHEYGHQMGLIDVYQLNVGPERNHVIETIGWPVSRGNGLMTSTACFRYSEHSAYAMNSNLHKRRGYFGEYLYDVPRTCRVRLVDAFRRPIAGATIKFYQDHCQEWNTPPDFTGVTDSEGYYTMPNRTVYGEMVTGTGHVLHDNPWGLIYCVGFNNVFLCEIDVNGQTDYQFIEILPFNIAYWAGHTETYTYDLQTSLLPEGPVTPRILFGIKMISQNLGYAVGTYGTILRWDGSDWSAVSSPTTATLRAVDSDPTGSLVCVVGDGGKILINTGSGWVTKSAGTTTNLRACAVTSANTIYVGGDSGRLHRSTDGGNTWSQLSILAPIIRSIDFYDSNRGVLVANSGVAYYTVKGGIAWGAGSGMESTGNAMDCSMVSASEAWACTDTGRVFRSTNGGLSWSEVWDFGSSEGMNAIALTSGGKGWCAGEKSDFGVVSFKRWQGGKWNNENVVLSADGAKINDISCVTADDAWAIGAGGLIIHLVNGNAAVYSRGSVAQTLAKPDGTPVVTTGCVVSGSFPGEVYVQSTDRSSGLKVLTSQNLTPGTLAQVTGILDTSGLERIIRFGDIIGLDNTTVKSLGMKMGSLTGTADDPGLRTIPLLVRITGCVTARDDSGWFTLDDGSGMCDALGNKGVKVKACGFIPPSVGAFVSVTGISSFESSGGQTYPLIRTRNTDDMNFSQ